MKSIIAGLVFASMVITGCAKPLVTGNVVRTQGISKVFRTDPNTLYYAIKWAMGELGYPDGEEDLKGGIIQTKWVPTGAASHSTEFMGGRYYNPGPSYYKLVIKVVPLGSGETKVEVSTEVNGLVRRVATTGEKEREFLEKVALHAREKDITVTNLGGEE